MSTALPATPEPMSAPSLPSTGPGTLSTVRPSLPGPVAPPTLLSIAPNIAVRPLQLDDAAPLSRMANDREVWENNRDTFPHPYKLSDAEAFINTARDPKGWLPSGSSWMGPAYPAMLAITVDGQVAGSCGMKLETDVERRGAMIGYWVGSEFRGRGVATAVARAYARWIFDTFPQIVRIEAGVHDYNAKSSAVLRKAGFELLCTRRFAVWKDERLCGLQLWEMIRPGLV